MQFGLHSAKSRDSNKCTHCGFCIVLVVIVIQFVIVIIQVIVIIVILYSIKIQIHYTRISVMRYIINHLLVNIPSFSIVVHVLKVTINHTTYTELQILKVLLKYVGWFLQLLSVVDFPVLVLLHLTIDLWYGLTNIHWIILSTLLQ
jgi:hypothetical protein